MPTWDWTFQSNVTDQLSSIVLVPSHFQLKRIGFTGENMPLKVLHGTHREGKRDRGKLGTNVPQSNYTQTHALLISMQKKEKEKKRKKDQQVFERRKRQPFIFHFGCPWSGDSTSFWRQRTMKRASHLHKNTCLYSTTGRGGGGGKQAFYFRNGICLLGIISMHGQGKIRIGFLVVVVCAKRVVQQCWKGAWRFVPLTFLQWWLRAWR